MVSAESEQGGKVDVDFSSVKSDSLFKSTFPLHFLFISLQKKADSPGGNGSSLPGIRQPQPHVVDHVQPEHYSNLGPRLLILGVVFAPDT